MKNKTVSAEFVLVFVTMLWGGTFLAIKTALISNSSFVILFIRFFLASVLMLIIKPELLKSLNKKILFRGSVLGFFLFIGYSMQTLGLKYTTINKSSFITYTFAVFVPPLQFIICRKKVKIINLVGLFIVFAGLYFINKPSGGAVNTGDFLTFIGAVATAFFIVFLDIFSSRESPYLLTIIQFLVISLLSLVFVFIFEDFYFEINYKFIISILYLSIPGSIFAIYLMNKFQQKTSPVRAVIIYSLEPVFATLFAFLFIQEKLSFSVTIGAVFILTGVIFSESLQYLKKQNQLK